MLYFQMIIHHNYVCSTKWAIKKGPMIETLVYAFLKLPQSKGNEQKLQTVQYLICPEAFQALQGDIQTGKLVAFDTTDLFN